MTNTDSEITPLAIFIPDRCIYRLTVKEVGSGWYVTLNGGATYFLDSMAKHGWRNPSVGAEIEIMLASGLVAGWRVTGN